MSATTTPVHVQPFHDPATATFTYVVHDHDGGKAAIIDPVLDYDPASARTATTLADQVLAYVAGHRLDVAWLLETHMHADHLSAAAYLKRRTGARTGAGAGVPGVQQQFKALYHLGDDFRPDGSQFDHLFADGETFPIGSLECRVMATPGHTSDSLTYVIGDAAFIGDTLFAPDTGTARTDFPGGDARALFRAIGAILALPADTRLFLCHDYPPAGREPTAETSIAAQASGNPHIAGIDEAGFVALRTRRDAGLDVPKLVLPALQVNIRAGEFPPADANGIRYLRLPLDQFGKPA